MNELLELFLVFVKIGATNFGGGYAMLPLLERELSTKRGWVTLEELMDYFAIGQCTPGVIALNVSTFIGNKRKGVIGALCSTIGFLLVPVCVIIIIAIFLRNFAELQIVKDAFAGIRICVCALILQAVIRLWKKAIVDRVTFGLYLAIFAATILSSVLPFSIPTAVLVITAGIFGMIFGRTDDEVGRKKGDK